MAPYLFSKMEVTSAHKIAFLTRVLNEKKDELVTSYMALKPDDLLTEEDILVPFGEDAQNLTFLSVLSTLFKEDFMEKEAIRSLEMLILPPLVLQKNPNALYSVCPYEKNGDPVYAPSLPFAFYFPDKGGIFYWFTDGILKGMLKTILPEEALQLSCFQNRVLHGVTRERADELALAFRVFWKKTVLDYCFWEAEVPLETANLTIFRTEYEAEKESVIYTLTDLGYEDPEEEEFSAKFSVAYLALKLPENSLG